MTVFIEWVVCLIGGAAFMVALYGISFALSRIGAFKSKDDVSITIFMLAVLLTFACFVHEYVF